MIHTYDEYQQMPQSLTLEQMVQLHRELAEEVGTDEHRKYTGFCWKMPCSTRRSGRHGC